MTDNISENPAINQIPSTSKNGGRIAIPKMKNINVLNKERNPEIFPFENAVNIPLVNILNPHSKKLIENKLNPLIVI